MDSPRAELELESIEVGEDEEEEREELEREELEREEERELGLLELANELVDVCVDDTVYRRHAKCQNTKDKQTKNAEREYRASSV